MYVYIYMYVCVYTHIYVHTSHMHTYTHITHTYAQIKKWKTIPRKCDGPYMSGKRSQKVKHYNRYYLNQKKLLTSNLKLTQGHC